MSKPLTIKSRKSYTYKSADNDNIWVLKVFKSLSNGKWLAKVYFPETGYYVTLPEVIVRTKRAKDRRKLSILNIGFLGDLYETFKEQDPILCKSLYTRWKHMIYRCYDKSHKSHNSYFDKGITVCERWHNFSTFYRDTQLLPGYDREKVIENKLSLDKDAKQTDLQENKIYSPATCVWLTYKEQQKYVNHYCPPKVKLKIIHPNGLITIEEGLGRCSKKYNVDMKCMNRVLKGLQDNTKGYKFEYVTEIDHLK